MKKKLNLFATCLILFISTFFCSCSKDVYEENSSTIKESFVLKNVSLHDLALKSNEKLMKKVNFVKSLKNNTESSRLIYNPELDFYLDENNGKYAESSDGHSYTFPIFKSTDSDKVKNLVFVSQPNGEYKTFLFDYNLTKEQMDNLTNAQIANLPYEVFTVDETTTAATFGKQDACLQLWVWDRIEAHQGDNTGGPLWYWGWVLAYDSCSGGGRSDDASSNDSSGSDSDAPTGNTGTSGSSNPTGGGSGTGNTVITSPNSGLTPKQYRFLAQLNPLSAGDTWSA